MSSATIHLETFGCQMNELDSELVAGQLAAMGYRFVSDPEDADIVMYNTCSVRDHAEQKVRSRLGELAGRKRLEPTLVVAVIGCMAEREGEDLIRRSPAVDVLCGPGELDKLPSLLDNALRTRRALHNGEGSSRLGSASRAGQIALAGNASRRTATLAAATDQLELLDLSRSISPIDHNGSAYVRITRGCNKFCAYCVVPFTRGAETHRPPDHIVAECHRLADAGVVEVTLLGQTVNHYRFEHGAVVTAGGVQQPQKGRPHKGASRRDPFDSQRVTTFADLLRRIHDRAPSIKRLRFVTSYPRDFGDDVLEVIRDCPRICRYLHAPAQSGSDAQLARMNRGYTIGEYLDFLDRARAFLDQPEIGRPLMIAGDMIVGFSGETEADFQASIRLLQRARYKSCFIFKYSPRPGTVAFDRLPDDVPEADKRRRNNELLDVQQRVSDEIAQAQIGRVFEVFVEGLSAHERKRRRRTTPAPVALTVAGRSPALARSQTFSEEGPVGPVATPQAQLCGRTDGDLITLFDTPAHCAPDELIGRIVPVRIETAGALALFGAIVDGPP